MDGTAMIHEVDEEMAEAVLSVRLFIPDVAEGVEARYFLARVSPRSADYVVESVTVNPDGSITEIKSLSYEESKVAHASHACGQTAEGRGFGYGKTVFIEGRSAEELVVHLSMYWTARNGVPGRLEEELVVPWLGAARVELSTGGWLACEVSQIGAQSSLHTGLSDLNQKDNSRPS